VSELGVESNSFGNISEGLLGEEEESRIAPEEMGVCSNLCIGDTDISALLEVSEMSFGTGTSFVIKLDTRQEESGLSSVFLFGIFSEGDEELDEELWAEVLPLPRVFCFFFSRDDMSSNDRFSVSSNLCNFVVSV